MMMDAVFGFCYYFSYIRSSLMDEKIDATCDTDTDDGQTRRTLAMTQEKVKKILWILLLSLY